MTIRAGCFKFIKHTAGWAFVFLFLLFSSQVAFCAGATVVRVGYYENPPKLFGSLQDGGWPRGIFPDIIADIAGIEGWQIKWVPGTWRECLARLESGEIDVMPDVAYSLKRSEKYAFTEEPVFINWAVLYTRAGIHVESLFNLEEKRVAVMRGSIHTEGEEGIKKQTQRFRIHCEFVEFDSYSEVFLALQNNLADAGVVNRLFGVTSQKLYDVLPTSIVFNPRHLKFAFPKHGRLTPQLKETIDIYLRTAGGDPDSKMRGIIQSYLYGIPLDSFSKETLNKILLTPEEKSWIAAHPKIRIGVDPEFAPFEFIDKNGEYSGYAADYLQMLNERLNLNMVVVERHSWKEVVVLAEKGEIDVLPAVGYTNDRSRFLSYTTPYMGFYRMVFCRSGAPFISDVRHLRNLKVAVQAGSSHAGWIRDNTDLVPVYYDTLEETIQAVSDGEADVFVGNLAASTYWIRKLNITNLRAAAPISLERQLLHMAVRKDWPILVSLLNKGLASISSQEAEDIRNRWTAAGYSVGLSSRVVWQRIGITLLLSMFLVGYFWYWNKRLQREISLRVKAEKQLVEGKEKLAQRVRERTHELAEVNAALQREHLKEQELREKLYRAEKMEALGLMAGGVAHDLNNILAGIVSYPDLMLVDLPEDSPMREPLQVMKSSGKRAADVVADLLTLARGVTTEKHPENLNTLINEFIDSPEWLQIQQVYPDVICRVDLADDLCLVLCSKSHLKKCLLNLMTNALEAMGDSGELTVFTRNSSGNEHQGMSGKRLKGPYVALRIVDTGPGISDDDINHIFEPFYSKKIKGRSGTGLGLAVVWNAVQDHNGIIQVRSGDAGTEFEIHFPATLMPERESSQPVDKSELYGKGETVLVVDDEKQSRDVACNMLSAMGYRVECVGSGEEALEFLQQRGVDLVVLDMIMAPGISGLKTYEQIIEIVPGQKAVIVSGFSESEEVKKAQQLGASQYIKKPFTYKQLGLAVKAALS